MSIRVMGWGRVPARRRIVSSRRVAGLVVLFLHMGVTVPAGASTGDIVGGAAALALNAAPIANAGADQTLTLADPALLLGTMSDDGLPDPDAVPRASWNVISGPGVVEFANSQEALTSATFSAAGTYVLRLTVDDGISIASDDATITVTATPPNTIRVPQDHTTIQAAVDAAQSGDLVLVSPGTYVEDVYIGKSITLASTYYTTGDPTLVDQTTISATSSLTETVTFTSGAGVEARIVGFTVRDGKDGVKIRGIASVIDNRFVDLATDAVDFSADAAGMVLGNVMENNGDDAVDIDQASVLIQGNEARSNDGDAVEIRATNTANPFLTIIIRGNLFANNNQDGIQLIDNDAIGDTNAVLVIDRNVIVGNLQAGIGLMDGADTTEDYRAASLLERIHLFNNTLVGNDHGLTGGDNVIALNNVFIDHVNIAVKQVDGSSILAHNLFWNNGVDNSGSNVDTATTVSADPQLDNSYQPSPGSPVVDAGTASFTLPSGEVVLDLAPADYSGSAPDIGRHESDLGASGLPPSVDAGPDQSLSLPVLSATLNGSVSDDGLPDPPAFTSTLWTQVSGPNGVLFEDETAVDTTATFPGAGDYVLRLTADDSFFSVSDDVIVSIIDPNAGSVDVRVASGADDAEEALAGNVSLGSSDLELTSDGGAEQTVGIRFASVDIPEGATVTSATVQFQVDESDSVPTDLTISGEAADNPPSFTNSSGDVGSRALTTASVTWAPLAWSGAGTAGPDQRTPNLSAVIQEIVDRPGWAPGNAIVIIVSGTGVRTAESFDGDPQGAPLLQVEYTTEPPVPNDPPVAGDDGVSTLEDVAVTFDVVANDTDADGNLDPASVTTGCVGCSEPSSGSLVNHGDGTFTFTPAADFNGTDGFTYQVCDDLGACDTAVVSITVDAVNDPPVAVDDVATTAESVAVTVDVVGNDSDVDGDGLSVSNLGAASNGGVVDNGDGTVTYTPDPGFTGTDTFTYTANDGTTDSPTATVTITVDSTAPQTVEVRVAASSDDAEERDTGLVSLTSSDLELAVDGSRGAQTVGMRFVSVEVPQGATVTAAWVQLQADETDSDASDLLIRGEAVDDAVTFRNSSGDISGRVSTAAAIPWSPPAWDTVGEAGPNQQTPDISSIIQEIVHRPGWVSGNSVVLTVTGSGTRTAESYNGQQGAAPLLHVEFTSEPVPNRPPVAEDDDATTQIDTAVTIDVAANDSDPDDNLDPDSASTTCAGCAIPSDGTLENLGAGSFRYTPDTGFIGDDGFVYEICDSELLCATAAVSVMVTTAAPQVIDLRVVSGSDDAEERDTGTVSVTSSDLELVADANRGRQTVGIRFAGLNVPAGAAITSAWLQFWTDETGDVATDLVIQGQAADDPVTFTNTRWDVTSRPRTAAQVAWSVPPWNAVGEAGLDQRSPDLATILQEIVDRPGWASGNAVAFVITGAGTRTAEAYNGVSTRAPLIHVEYFNP